jgi:heme-degrading monooxygenase HmoA
MMIARIWHGFTKADKADEYLAYLQETGVEHTRGTPGNHGVHILRRVADGRAEFLFTSFWDSLEAVHAFAGPDIERAVYYPKDAEYLLELEPTVAHYEVYSFGQDT